jgi:hypothetical protein
MRECEVHLISTSLQPDFDQPAEGGWFRGGRGFRTSEGFCLFQMLQVPTDSGRFSSAELVGHHAHVRPLARSSIISCSSSRVQGRLGITSAAASRASLPTHPNEPQCQPAAPFAACHHALDRAENLRRAPLLLSRRLRGDPVGTVFA